MIPCYNTNFNSYQKWKIGNDLRAILLQDTGITAMVGQDIYPLVAPEGVEGEFIVYGREKYTKEKAKGGVWEDECQVFMTAISDNYDKATTLASLIDNALVGRHNINGHQVDIFLADSTETFEENKYIETLILTIE
jgi:hypothetical protein